ncbi:pyridoxamine 5'-phosphate oxidase family protein [Arthrobacter bambusae]|uniref:Pyridoxamine 5'-phosphate oxidase N-terminal domain-containing protein n=1 Tax=Arthrobacter bambusae TaxID=1338426 RepID=A0AAW8DHP2_9MICC|nr:pyridoxamine 5'-phosphate oxidase family protein [Arthrobacter bambusae]MDP9906193.1 hypothetical protein [Arthrobacter bambusae]MDQ0130574.1 hypothetical protein [Arthrobacter bambusae]MDQ0182249.1 hypothetical protein [Arthrobacter bambusae]
MSAGGDGDRVPEALALALGGTFGPGGAMSAECEAVAITTVDEDGWPRTALLSLAEVVLTSNGRIAILLHNGSTGAANLRRNGRLLVTVAAGGNLYDLKFTVQEQGPVLTNPPRTTFTGMLRAVREQRASYATVTSGIRFILHASDTVLPRWHEQLTHLQSALDPA